MILSGLNMDTEKLSRIAFRPTERLKLCFAEISSQTAQFNELADRGKHKNDRHSYLRMAIVLINLDDLGHILSI